MGVRSRSWWFVSGAHARDILDYRYKRFTRRPVCHRSAAGNATSARGSHVPAIEQTPPTNSKMLVPRPAQASEPNDDARRTILMRSRRAARPKRQSDRAADASDTGTTQRSPLSTSGRRVPSIASSASLLQSRGARDCSTRCLRCCPTTPSPAKPCRANCANGGN